MKKTALLILLLIGMTVAAASAGQSDAKRQLDQSLEQAAKDLDAKYKHWLDMVTYLTFKEERKVFLQLTSDRDRDAFINMFWLQRDPTPGTPENEYKNEIEKRFAYVNEFLKRGSSRPGWMTDQGKIYMILGKPNTIDLLEEKAGLFPVQVWYYYGDSSLGLPTYYNIVFYKRFGVGEWKLYNPLSDGPGALLIEGHTVGSENYAELYKKIYELAPTLASPAFSMIPNQVPANFMPSVRANIILSSIFESPTKKLNVSYATNFLKYKGFVNIESSVNFVANSTLVSLIREDRFDTNFINISIRPKKISVGYNDDREKYFFNLNLNVSLRKNEIIIFQYAKNYEFYFDPDKVGVLEAGGVVVHDSFPVIPGDFQLVIYIENTVGKEFSYFDQAIQVPASGNVSYLATPILGYKEETENSNFFHAYKFLNKKLSVDTEKMFSLNDTPQVLIGAYNLTPEMWEQGAVELELKGLNERYKFSRTVQVPLKNRPYAKNINLFYPLDKTGLHADYYELTLRLRNPSGILLDTKKTDFTISPIQNLSHPIETYKQVVADNAYFYDYILGQQYEGCGNLEKAESYFEKSVKNNPDFAEGWVSLLNSENKLQKYPQVLAAVENLKKFAKFNFDYQLIKGTALFGLEKFDQALDELLKANKIYNSDIRVLNLIGFAFLKLNNMEEALKALNASLTLNNKQPNIEKIVVEIKNRTRQAAPTDKVPKK